MEVKEKPNHYRQILFHNRVEDVTLLGSFISKVAEEENIDSSMAFRINLAVEEALVNIINYAYPEGTTGEIMLKSCVSPEKWTLTLIDSGQFFDPTKADDADVNADLSERPVGGLGIFLVRQNMDDISYQRKDGKNILTLTKLLNI